MAGQPDLQTLEYWVRRLRQLPEEGEESENGVEGDIDGVEGDIDGVKEDEKQIVVIFANRTGEEGVAERIVDVRYAESSYVMGMQKSQRDADDCDDDNGDAARAGGVRLWSILGRAEEGALILDTDEEPKFGLGMRWRTERDGDDEEEASRETAEHNDL